jgi:hypothetical protein
LSEGAKLILPEAFVFIQRIGESLQPLLVVGVKVRQRIQAPATFTREDIAENFGLQRKLTVESISPVDRGSRSRLRTKYASPKGHYMITVNWIVAIVTPKQPYFVRISLSFRVTRKQYVSSPC